AHQESAELCKRKEVKKLYTRPETDLQEGEARLSFWGCRGLGAALANDQSAFGRQTPCVSVETVNSVFILDGGTGIVPLGEKLLRQGGPKNVWIILSHMHISHVMGLPYFPCLREPDYKISFAGACGSEKKLRQVAEELFYGSSYWPARRPRAEVSLFELAEDSGEIAPGVLLSALGANHPSDCLALKLELYGKKIVYAPDSELKPDPYALESYNERLAGFAQGADVLIHDAYYTDDDYPANSGKGHSSVLSAVELAGMAHVKNLILFHANSAYPDSTLRQMLQQAKQMATDNRWDFACHLAREGLSISYKSSQEQGEGQ
ncbi:MAG TPA: MBL fold metallo-hydrolase, partial [Elusimicrobiales bacterium]|nr:MBL fold metallo-hydrolase [Elusimicrobiales bacterium]